MDEVIQNIIPFEDENGYEGYKVITDKQTAVIGIENDQQCCESFGYFASIEDKELSFFIGATLTDITFTDTARSVRGVEALETVKNDWGDSGGVMFVDFHTNRGVLQLTVYNAHNGWYGHAVYFKSNQLTAENTL